ncbi:MAG: hypothetical protein V7726_01670 [Pseudoalteromonas distincta]|uniref:hypothetical protein n=1 Tax=Pseudoalteromonas distincta TaxID=77608 RepID=UPI0030015850
MDIPCWCKIGKTTKGLQSRHTASQNPSYFIHTGFNILRGNVHQIEKELLDYLVSECGLERIHHVGTLTHSECFYFTPEEMVNLVENFIDRYYSSSVTYENSLHGGMSRYLSPIVLNNYLMRPAFPINKRSYFTGNQEVYETDLGDGLFLDHSTGQQFYREDEDEDEDF